MTFLFSLFGGYLSSIMYRSYALIRILNRPLITAIFITVVCQLLLIGCNGVGGGVRAEANGAAIGQVDPIDRDNDNDGIPNSQEVTGCVLNPDCDDDGVADGDEQPGCVVKSDCDGDGIADRDEQPGCVVKSDCDGDGVADGYEKPVCVVKSDCDDDKVLDSDEKFGCVLNPDCDGDGIADGDEQPGCVVKSDCDHDGVADGDEQPGCVVKSDCDDDGVADGYEKPGCVVKSDCDGDGITDGDDGCPSGQSGWRSDGTNDVDSDGCPNDEDIDDDGDGLIEVRTARELDAVRYALDGSGRKMTATASLNQNGCGGDTDIRRCSGYELMIDIDLTDYIAEKYPTEGWLPIAHDTNSNNEGKVDGSEFTGIFDGNGFEVKGLFISRPNQDHIGLFGQVNGGIIRHLGVVADRIIGRFAVGSLGGLLQGGAETIQSYAVSGVVSGNGGVGGLVGSVIEDSKVVGSYAVSSAVSGEVHGGGNRRYGNVGGLVGVLLRDGEIVQSYGVSGTVRGDIGVGGLVGGNSGDSKIIQSYAVSGSVSGEIMVGGLVGHGGSIKIIQSYVVSGAISSPEDAIAEHYAETGNTGVGALIGEGDKESKISQSYWDTQTSEMTDDGVAASSVYTSQALRSPTGYDTIYSSWAGGVRTDGVDITSTIWCDEDFSGVIEANERRDTGHSAGNNQVWDFGTNTDYPALRCTPDNLDEQRAWWVLDDATHKPQLNQARLNAYLEGSHP